MNEKKRKFIELLRSTGRQGIEEVINYLEKSVIMLLSLGLKLTLDETVAIRWHMGAWDLAFQSYEAKSNINEAGNRYSLLSLIQSADNMATHILEL